MTPTHTTTRTLLRVAVACLTTLYLGHQITAACGL